MDVNILSDLKVAVLMGAVGQERQISLQSGKCIADALRKTKLLDVIEYDFQPDRPDILDDKSIDVFFLAFHGEFGEGGQMQEICEKKGLVFTGSDSRASRLGFDKIACKKALKKANLPVADAIEIRNSAEMSGLDSQLEKIGNKFVVKPIRQGSSVGVKIIDNAQDAKIAAEHCLEQFGDCMVEKFVAGREVTVGILGDMALPVIEIMTNRRFYDYDAKYDDDKAQLLFDTIDDGKLVQKINDIALKSFKAIGCRDFGRVDMILDSGEIPYIIELNTIPGFTSHSLFPKSAAKAGIDMSELCLKIIEMALKRRVS